MQNQRVSKKTAFCAVCQKAGKSEKEYTSHFTKSKPGEGGVVTCPTILNSVCTYCREKGHFKSACPKLELKMRLDSVCGAAKARGSGRGGRGGVGGGGIVGSGVGTGVGVSTAPVVTNRYSGLLDASDDSDAEDEGCGGGVGGGAAVGGIGVGGIGVGGIGVGGIGVGGIGVGGIGVGGIGVDREIPKPELVRGVVQNWSVLQNGTLCAMPDNIIAIIEETEEMAEEEVEYKERPRRRWADYSDSEDEDEDVDVSFVC